MKGVFYSAVMVGGSMEPSNTTTADGKGAGLGDPPNFSLPRTKATSRALIT